MDPLEVIIGSNKYHSLKALERRRINDLLAANPVYIYLVAGILNQTDWRRVLGAAYIKFVGSNKPNKPVKEKKFVVNTNSQSDVIFGVGDTSEFTKTSLAI